MGVSAESTITLLEKCYHSKNMADVEVAEALQTSLREIKANKGDKELATLITPARSIISLGEGLIHFSNEAHHIDKTENTRDGEKHTETFGYTADSEIGQYIATLIPNSESEQDKKTSVAISYKPTHPKEKMQLPVQMRYVLDRVIKEYR
jgi:hypothetical protein